MGGALAVLYGNSTDLAICSPLFLQLHMHTFATLISQVHLTTPVFHYLKLIFALVIELLS